MISLYYFAAWTDSHCLVGCDHQHETVISAVACCTSAGAYVVAVEKSELRELNDKEKMEFQYAMYGRGMLKQRLLSTIVGVLALLYRFAGLHP